MRLFLLLLSCVAAPACAEWVKVSESAFGSSYIDLATIRKNGDLLSIWELQDMKQREKDGEMSRRILYEYDCKERRHRGLSAFDYSEPMAGGRILVSVNTPSNWSRVEPASIAETILKAVCAK